MGSAVPDGEVGEIQVRGPPVFDGYLDDPALNAAAFVDGWFRTGDLGRRAADGEVHLVGRAKEVINRGGDKIAPLEIDAALHALPGVVDAAAFGVPHPRLGEEVVAAVVAQDASSFDTDAALAQLRAVLGARRAPRRIWIVDALPRNDAGKVLRRSMAAWVGFDPAAHADAADVDDDAERVPFRGAAGGDVGKRARPGRDRARRGFRRAGRRPDDGRAPARPGRGGVRRALAGRRDGRPLRDRRGHGAGDRGRARGRGQRLRQDRLRLRARQGRAGRSSVAERMRLRAAKRSCFSARANAPGSSRIGS